MLEMSGVQIIQTSQFCGWTSEQENEKEKLIDTKAIMFQEHTRLLINKEIAYLLKIEEYDKLMI